MMTRKKVWRFYCEFCKKSGCSGGHIKDHEESCTNNPNRVCGFHGHPDWADGPQRPIAELIVAARSGETWADGMKALRDAADNCPACILAALKQSGVWKDCMDEYAEEWEERGGWQEGTLPRPRDAVLSFNYQAEAKDFWATVNDAHFCD
jgi:hypothetical protein